MIRVALKEHLERLRAIETLKDGEKKEVPSMDQLARMLDIHRGTLNRLANNHKKAIRFELLGLIIKVLQDLGFQTDVNDILVYEAKQALKKA